MGDPNETGRAVTRRAFLASAAAAAAAACAPRPPDAQEATPTSVVGGPEKRGIPEGWKEFKSKADLPIKTYVPPWDHEAFPINTTQAADNIYNSKDTTLLIIPMPDTFKLTIDEWKREEKSSMAEAFLVKESEIKERQEKIAGQNGWIIESRNGYAGDSVKNVIRAIFIKDGQGWGVNMNIYDSSLIEQRRRDLQVIIDNLEFTGPYVQKKGTPESGFARHETADFTIDYPKTWTRGGSSGNTFVNGRGPQGFSNFNTAVLEVGAIALDQGMTVADLIQKRKNQLAVWRASQIEDSLSSKSMPDKDIAGPNGAVLLYRYSGGYQGDLNRFFAFATSNRTVGVMDIYIPQPEKKRAFHIQSAISFNNSLNDPEAAALRQDEANTMKMIASFKPVSPTTGK